MDADEVVKRPMLVRPEAEKEVGLSKSPLAEHGFSSFITVTGQKGAKCMLFDFGCSDKGAAFNAELLGLDLTRVEALALSHGHFDHFGGMKELVKRTQRKDLALVCHPGVFQKNRFMALPGGVKLNFPVFCREDVRHAGAALVEKKEPFSMLDGACLFLGEIPRVTKFEKGMQNAYYLKDGVEVFDPLSDDTSLVFHVKGKGLVILSGCAHSGIINTVEHARRVTGVDRVYAVMGGFHLTGPAFEHQIEPTIASLQKIDPEYVIPAHCTGRNATLAIERAMPEKFLLNMSCTTMNFGA
jgi:7,8-dihydropterin-6-yl-methyl-4-(beta-D-ribofuranosyl)aminobenzene 5'-phosphate synthase